MFIVTSVLKGTTLNKKKRLDHDLLRRPEVHILKISGLGIKGAALYKGPARYGKKLLASTTFSMSNLNFLINTIARYCKAQYNLSAIKKS